MVLFASQVSQQIYASQLSMQQQQMHAQQLSQQMLMPHMGLVGAVQSEQGGLYGEQFANRLANAGRTGIGLGSLGLGVAGAMTGMPLDPFSAALKFGGMGFRAAGVGGFAAGALAGAVPFWAAGQVAGAYTGAFSGGMREQAATNSTLRNTFNFQGGQGAMGRGFSQSQMGQIGNTISAETMRSPFTSSNELNQLIGQGAESGMFTAVRDVQSFTQRFRTMLDGLKKIQKELGGTLSDAMAFTRGSQQLGIFTTGGRSNFAAEMRDTMATTGMDQQQLFSLAATGSMLSRATGGVGRQGALGALRTARTLGAAVSSGAVNNELLSEATGGLQGADAVQALTARTLQLSDRFTRTAAGRYSIFSVANEDGTGLDQAAVDRLRNGDTSVGSIMRDAHRNVNRMGRARAMNQEGRLRGAAMEEGGLSLQLGIMRQRIGDRALEGGDDLAQLVMQRKMGVSQSEAQVYTSLLRNQSAIANSEDVDRSMAKRQTSEQQDIAINRSLESFMANMQQGMQDATGVTRAREMGRKFLTGISSMAEKTMNDFLGISANALSTEDQRAITRLGLGQSSSADRARLNFGGGGGDGLGDAYSKSASSRLLEGFGFEGARSMGEMMEGRGHSSFKDMGGRARGEALRAMEQAQTGRVVGTDLAGLKKLMADDGAMHDLAMADFGGGRDSVYKRFGSRGISANAADAFAHKKGYDLGPNNYMQASTGGRGDWAGSYANASSVIDNTLDGAIAGGITGAASVGILTGGLGSLIGGLAGAAIGGGAGLISGVLNTPMNAQEKAVDFIARGGHAAKAAEAIAKSGKGTKDLTSEDAAMLVKGFGGKNAPDSEAMKTVLESDSFKASVRRLGGMGARGQQAELAEMERTAGAMGAGKEKHAMIAAVQQLRYNISKNNGKLGSEWGFAFQDNEKAQAARRMYADIGGEYGGLAEKVGDKELQGMFNATSNAFYSYDTKGASESTDAVQKMLAGLDPDSDRYRAIVKDIGSDEKGRAALNLASQRRNAVTQFEGKGRRGRAGAADAILGAVTGNTIGEMDITVAGEGGKRRTLPKRNQAQYIYEQFSKGGAIAEDVSKQLVTNLEAQGVKDAELHVEEVRRSVYGKGKDRGVVTKDEANKMFDGLRDDDALKQLQLKGVQAAQARNDPLGDARNKLLQQILDKLPDKPGAIMTEGGGVDPLQSS